MPHNLLELEFVALRRGTEVREAASLSISAPVAGSPGDYVVTVMISGFDNWSIKAFGVHPLQCIENAIKIVKTRLLADEADWQFEDANGALMPFSY